jgi:hypothetical protein
MNFDEETADSWMRDDPAAMGRQFPVFDVVQSIRLYLPFHDTRDITYPKSCINTGIAAWPSRTRNGQFGGGESAIQAGSQVRAIFATHQLTETTSDETV